MFIGPICQMLDSGEDPSKTIEQFIMVTIINQPEQQRKLGCLLVNTVVELKGVDDELVAEAGQIINRVISSCIALFERGQKQGMINEHKDPKALAAFFINCVNGMRVTAKQGCSEKTLKQITATALDVLKN